MENKTRNCENGELECSEADESLYPEEILTKLDFNKCHLNFAPAISITNPGDNLIVRPLRISDYQKGYLELLSQLTRVGDVSEEKFRETFHAMKSCKDCYYITVIEDTVTNQLVGSATLAIERKFIHSAGLRGRLEDVVVNNSYRGRQLGKLIVVTIKLLAEYIGCYKITLDCKDKMVQFYSQFGFVCETGNNNMMTIRFKD